MLSQRLNPASKHTDIKVTSLKNRGPDEHLIKQNSVTDFPSDFEGERGGKDGSAGA